MTREDLKNLLNPKVFPHKVKYLKLRETYISWLIFTGNFVYKIKKPVKFSYLDFSSLYKRKFFLKEELKLNIRLEKEIYLDVVPIVKKNGQLRILESSKSPLLEHEKIREYALKMKEIPEKYYAPELIKKRKFKKISIKKIARIVANFHKLSQNSPEIDKYGSIKLIKKNSEENFRQVKPFVGKVIDESIYKFITRQTRKFLKENKDSFLKRIREKKIRDCHGDLHTGNIFITPRKIYIIDCIEFNKRFRYQDIASDIAFLAMDFDYLGRPDFSKYFVNEYNLYLKDRDLFKILPFYKCYRAYVRAKVGCLSLPREDILAIQKYFSLAFKYALEFSRKKSILLIICGQISTGKTYLAEYLSKIMGAVLLRSDTIRKKILNIPLYKHRKKGLEKIYSRGVTGKVYKKMIGDGLKFLKDGQLVILDATFTREIYRKMVIRAIERKKIPYFFIECKASKNKILERLRKRRKKKEISDATVNVYLQKRGEFEKIKLPKEHYVSINTEKDDINEEANKVLKRCLK